MKLISVLVIFATYSVYSMDTSMFQPGVKVEKSSIFLLRDAATVTCDKTIGPLCSSDCATLMTCINKPDPIFTLNCGTKYPDKPYCVDKACTNQPDTNTKCRSSFECTSDGIFPDPSDCTKYHLCDSGISALYTCNNNQVFFSEAKLCRSKISSSFCQTLDCSKRVNEWTTFSANPAYYAFCLNDKDVKKTLMFKCPDEENFIFDLIKNACVYNCKTEGNFVDRFDCTKYVNCARNSIGKYDSTSQSCPSGYYFKTTKCVKGTCTPEIVTTPVKSPEVL